MTSTYELVLAAEAGVVALAGLAIAYMSASRRDVVLYPLALGLLGLGLWAAGVGTILLAFDRGLLATGMMVLAALAYVASGWYIAADAVSTDESFATEQLGGEPTRGFEEER